MKVGGGGEEKKGRKGRERGDTGLELFYKGIIQMGNVTAGVHVQNGPNCRIIQTGSHHVTMIHVVFIIFIDYTDANIASDLLSKQKVTTLPSALKMACISESEELPYVFMDKVNSLLKIR